MINDMAAEMDAFETKVFNNQTKANVKQDIEQFFCQQVPEVDYSDPSVVFAFFRKLTIIFLKYVADHQSTFTNRID